MKFTIVRHGETEANRRVVLSGHRDTPLTDTGIAQAEKVGLRLRDQQFTAAYSSDLSRAVRTRDAILQYHPSVPRETLGLLRERNFGAFEEQPVSTHFDTLKQSGLPLWEFAPPNGENLIQVMQRASQFLSGLNHPQDAHVLIVGHFSINKTLIHALLGWDWDRWETLIQGNTCVNVIEINNENKVPLLLNCIRHLEE